MALYQDLVDVANNQVFVERCAVAVTVLADAVVQDATATVEEQAWAAVAVNEPLRWGRMAARLVLAANKDLSIAVIEAATDATLQANVNDAKAVLVAGNV